MSVPAATQPTVASPGLGIEANGINVIAESERKGTSAQLFWPWCASNVSVLAVSYGVQVGAIYAQLYPQRVRAMVLDATLEHDLSDALATAASVSTIEDSFDRFAHWCTRAPTCALHGQDVGRVFDRLVARADQHPIPVKGAIRPVTGEDAVRAGVLRQILANRQFEIGSVVGGEPVGPRQRQNLLSQPGGRTMLDVDRQQAQPFQKLRLLRGVDPAPAFGVEEGVGDLEWPQGRRDRMRRLQAFEDVRRERRGLIRKSPSHRQRRVEHKGSIQNLWPSWRRSLIRSPGPSVR